MGNLNRLDCRGTHVLIECDGRFAVVEERADRVYGIKPGRRPGYPRTPEGIVQAIGGDWRTEFGAMRLFDEITREAERLAQRIW
jgi:hypothetical protein